MQSASFRKITLDRKKSSCKNSRCSHCRRGPRGPPGKSGVSGPTGATGDSGSNQGFTLSTSLLNGTPVSGPVGVNAEDQLNYQSAQPIIIENTQDVSASYIVTYTSGYQTPGVLYVDSQSGTDIPAGFSQERQNPAYPFQTIQAAVEAAISGGVTLVNVNPGIGYTIDRVISAPLTLSFSDRTSVNVTKTGAFQVNSITCLTGNGADFVSFKENAVSVPGLPVFLFGKNTSNYTFNTIYNMTSQGNCFGLDDDVSFSGGSATCNVVMGFDCVFSCDRTRPVTASLTFQISSIDSCQFLFRQPNVNQLDNSFSITFIRGIYTLNSLNISMSAGNLNLSQITFPNLLSLQVYQSNLTVPKLLMTNCSFNQGIFINKSAIEPNIQGKLIINGSHIVSTNPYAVEGEINPGDPLIVVDYFGTSAQGQIGPFDPATIIPVNVQTS